ncbi:sugar kinase [Streptomyces sp. YIM 130001]|uniref:sugar kinase n=1 Tax=Streptomyces sp. YIM 130001 TaxID=2259644 RepID=UPI000E655623|nr:sugar kinase [Streptomyces sp. YIM 130001]
MNGSAPSAAPAGAADVVCLGESMVTFRPAQGQLGGLGSVASFDRGIGGAESNVACTLARAGHVARWVSRVGADGFGGHLVEEIASCGVDTSAVRRDPARPTGIYFRTAGERSTGAEADGEAPADDTPRGEVAYYRAGSAASAMSRENVDPDALADTRILHLSGITAALSADCRALLAHLTGPRQAGPLVSFDINYRMHLWPDAGTAGRVLKDLARGSDLVYVGEDEAEAVWGITGGPAAIRAALPEPRVLVVKQGADGATLFERPERPERPERSERPDGAGQSGQDTVTREPAPTVDVVAAVGAGDAFAAGFLSATLRALPAAQRLRHGHLMAAAALTVPGDLARPYDRETADRLTALPAAEWGALRIGAGRVTGNGEVVTG